jgi:hypothetical protein
MPRALESPLQTTLESNPEAPSRMSSWTRWLLPAAQLAAVLLAAWLGWRGYRLVYDDRGAIDEAAGWYALALVLLCFAAWDGALPAARPSIRAVASRVRAHGLELTLLAGIVAAGVCMRLYRFGDMPPNDYLILEEHINGGAMWDILHGARPYIYPTSRYLGALSLWIFGPTTTGLRAHTVAAGILAIPFFYLLMRELVTWRAALFATAIFASLRILGETSTHFETPMLFTIVTVWLTVRGLRTRNAMWLVPAAFLCAILSYEYETWKAVPLFIAAFVAFLLVRGLFLPVPRSLATVTGRVKEHAPFVTRAFIVVVIAVLMGLGPMFAEKHRGQDIYFSSLERQERDRDAAGTPGRFSPESWEHIKWSFQVYTPWVDPGYPVIGPVPTRGVIVHTTSLLLWAALVAGVLSFWRGYRALFVGWFLGGAIMAGMLLSAWSAWKLVGFLPPAIVLIGFLAEDVLDWADRASVRWRGVMPALVMVMALIVVTAFASNLRVQDANADDITVQREYGNLQSQLYSLCDNLRARPDDTYALASQRVRPGTPFATGTQDKFDESQQWGDFRFVCMGLQGRSVPDLQEAWPLFLDGDPERPITLAGVAQPDEVTRAIDALTRAMPELGPPDTLRTAPGDTFQTILFDTTASAINARRGLVLRDGAQDVGGQVVAGPDFLIDAGGPWELSGLVLLPAPMQGRLALDGATIDMRIEVDGAPAADGPQIAGWHLVRVSGSTVPAGALRMRWQRTGGGAEATTADSFFALADTNLWQHRRTYLTPDPLEALRYDFSPHFAPMEGFRIGAGAALPIETRVAEDRWSGLWKVPLDGRYRVFLWEPSGGVRLLIDGREITSHSGGGLLDLEVPLTAGDHRIEIIMTLTPDARYVGTLLRVVDPQGAEVAMDVRPF